MFKLRKEHLCAFEAHVVNLFTSRVIAHVKAVWPDECGELGENAIATVVRAAIQRAAALGLTSELEVIRFVDLAFILAPDFYIKPLSAWTQPILSDRKLTPLAKLDRLYQQMELEFALIEKRKAGKA